MDFRMVTFERIIRGGRFIAGGKARRKVQREVRQLQVRLREIWREGALIPQGGTRTRVPHAAILQSLTNSMPPPSHYSQGPFPFTFPIESSKFGLRTLRFSSTRFYPRCLPAPSSSQERSQAWWIKPCTLESCVDRLAKSGDRLGCASRLSGRCAI